MITSISEWILFWGSTHGFDSFKHVAHILYGSEIKFQPYNPIWIVTLNLDFSLEGLHAGTVGILHTSQYHHLLLGIPQLILFPVDDNHQSC